MTTTQPLVTDPATTAVVMSPLSPRTQTLVNAHREDDRDRKGVGALTVS